MKRISTYQSVVVATTLVIGFMFSLTTVMAAKTVKDELDAAKKAKKSVFLVVTGNGINSDKSMKLAQQAQKQTKESMVLTLNRDDKSNADVVTKLGLMSAPLPMIMVVGMNGIASGGLQEKEATAEKLVQMVPSPKKVEALALIDQKKPVFVVAGKKSFSDRTKVVENCKTAVNSMKGNAACVEIDMDDPREKAFLTQIGVDLKSKSTQIIVFNAQGKNTGSFSGVTDPGKLSATALTVPKASCCPSGSGASCGKK